MDQESRRTHEKFFNPNGTSHNTGNTQSLHQSLSHNHPKMNKSIKKMIKGTNMPESNFHMAGRNGSFSKVDEQPL